MEGKKLFRIIVALGIVVILLLQVYLFFQVSEQESEKIGYVQTHELVYKYKGYIDAQNEFTEKEMLLNKSIDSLKYAYQISIKNYQSLYDQLSDADMVAYEKSLQMQYQNMVAGVDELKSKIMALENQTLNEVITQINAYAIDFSKENGIRLLLGTTNDGSIMYGDEAIDYTEEMLDYINNRYDGN